MADSTSQPAALEMEIEDSDRWVNSQMAKKQIKNQQNLCGH